MKATIQREITLEIIDMIEKFLESKQVECATKGYAKFTIDLDKDDEGNKALIHGDDCTDIENWLVDIFGRYGLSLSDTLQGEDMKNAPLDIDIASLTKEDIEPLKNKPLLYNKVVTKIIESKL